MNKKIMMTNTQITGIIIPRLTCSHVEQAPTASEHNELVQRFRDRNETRRRRENLFGCVMH